MGIVVGTAGHIDHGKTTLLRALTGIDADRLPEEQRRGMTIDVGYAHLALPAGATVDFVDVPGHDRLVGNMLVGAGEIDAALVVVAADDGPRPQTREHLELLDALGIDDGIVAVTKADLVDADLLADRVAAVRTLITFTALRGAPVLAVSAADGRGFDALRTALGALAERWAARDAGARPGPRLAVDRSFSVRGRGTVVTGSLRGGTVSRGDVLRAEPAGLDVRIREIQVHGAGAERAGDGRVALNLAAVAADALGRGDVLAAPGTVVPTRRVLVALAPGLDLAAVAGAGTRPLPTHGERLRLHVGTAQVDALIVRNARTSTPLPGGAATALLRLERPIAASHGDRFVLRRASPGVVAAGGRVLDSRPPLGPSRRRATPAGLAALAAANSAGDTVVALVALHGAVRRDSVAILLGPGAQAPAAVRPLGPLLVDGALASELEALAIGAVEEHARVAPLAGGMPLAELRPLLVRQLRRRATLDRADAGPAATALIDGLVADGRIAAAGERVRLPSQAATLPPEVVSAMDRLEALLSVAAPQPFSDAVTVAGCPPEGVRALLAEGRVVRLEPELAYSRAAYGRLAALALRLADRSALTPAAFRDATGTSRKYALAILEDLDRRGLLRRTAEGHVPGPRAPRSAAPPPAP